MRNDPARQKRAGCQDRFFGSNASGPIADKIEMTKRKNKNQKKFNDLIYAIKTRKCEDSLYSLVRKCINKKSYKMMIQYFEESNEEDWELLDAMTLFKRQKTLNVIIEKYYKSKSSDYTSALISAIGGVGLSSGIPFLKKILPDLDDDIASIAYIVLGQLSDNEEEFIFILDDLDRRPDFKLWSNLYVAVEFFSTGPRSITMSEQTLKRLSKYEPLPLPPRFEPSRPPVS